MKDDNHLLKFLEQKSIYILMLLILALFAYMDYRYLDLQFLSYTGGDEFFMYHSLLRMYEGIINLDIEDLFRFDSYVYGFVWHLINMLLVAPFHYMGNEVMAIFMPRFFTGICSVLCLLMIFKICKIYLSYFYSYAIVLIVALMPGFYYSGYVFKPDVFQALLLLVSAYFLIKDNFAFKKNFYLGVLFFGLSVGAAKFQAVMFLPLIYLYIGVVFLRKPNIKNFKFIINYGILSTIAIVSLFIITNPYVLHPRGFGAWLWLFLHNMHSNATNHGSYIDVSLSEKLFKVVDFYYFEIIIFVIVFAFCIYFIFNFFKTKIKDLDVFFPIIGAVIISFLYLFFLVNKAWSAYYISTIYLCVLALIPFFLKFNFKVLAPLFLITQMGGGSSKFFLQRSVYKI